MAQTATQPTTPTLTWTHQGRGLMVCRLGEYEYATETITDANGMTIGHRASLRRRNSRVAIRWTDHLTRRAAQNWCATEAAQDAKARTQPAQPVRVATCPRVSNVRRGG